MSYTLPAPRPNQAHFFVSALEGGHVTVPLRYILDPIPDPADNPLIPVTTFLLRHSVTKRNTLFDLGVRKDYDNYPPALAQLIKDVFSPTDVSEDIVDSLAKGGLKPSDISTIFPSHIHWDHIGNPDLFPNSTFVAGGDAIPLLQKSYPQCPDSFYPVDLLPPDRTVFLEMTGPEWKPVGPFPRALDYYGDSSLYVVDASGHVQGHINLLVRTSADGGWMYLGGDSGHHWRIITGESGVAEVKDHSTGSVICMHADKHVAEEHIARIRRLLTMPRVRVAIAHNLEWYQENKGGPVFWPGAFESL